ncbi:MAG: ankyrin repeat domain-containing protein, partial [Bacteroidota bacterium]
RGASVDAQDNDGLTPLCLAAMYGQDNVIGLLLDLGADIEARSLRNRTPLHIAARRGQNGAVGLLLDRGADIEAKAMRNRTALHFAVRARQVETAGTLLSRGAVVNVHDNALRRVVDVLAVHNPEAAAHLLIARWTASPRAHR